MLMKKLGKAIRLLRLYDDKSIKEFAKEIGMSPNHLSEIERGNKNPNIVTIEKIGFFLEQGITASVILKFAEYLENDYKATTAKIQKSIIKTILAL